MTAADRLAAIRAREQAATPGPWVSSTTGCGCVYGGDGTVFEHGDEAFGASATANADFIAHARDDMPRMADALDAVLALHKPRMVPTSGSSDPRHEATWSTVCGHCGPLPYPCATVAAITDALGGAE